MTQPAQHNETAVLPDLPAGSTARVPIFILGMMPRSGTNFLHRLLCQHPDCGAINTTPVREDYLVHHIKWLRRYVDRLRWQWGNWGADEAFVAPLSTAVGHGLTDFLGSLSDAKRIVTKTPSVENLDAFFNYFADAHLLIIVRDGRSIVASGMSGFGWNFETATRKWRKTVREITAFQQKHAAYADRFKLVHYEALNANTVEELGNVLQFLDLDATIYDFEAALDTPVYGSSFMKGQGIMCLGSRKKRRKTSIQISGGSHGGRSSMHDLTGWPAKNLKHLATHLRVTKSLVYLVCCSTNHWMPATCCAGFPVVQSKLFEKACVHLWIA